MATSTPLLMIPGPTEFSPQVLQTLGLPSLSHVSPAFIEIFGSALEMTRQVLGTKNGQPFVLAGSGTLGWECIIANMLERGQKMLVVNTGYFSDSFADCAEVFGVEVTHVKAPSVGSRVPLEAVEEALKSNTYHMIALTQVDTSTAVLNDIKALSELTHRVSPSTLVAVDGVCSFGSEYFYMDEWKVDCAMTCSQKGLGVPPGLSIMAFSERSMDVFKSRKSKPAVYYSSFLNWLPVMQAYEQRKAMYFATPPVNLIRALHTSLSEILSQGLENRFRRHAQMSGAFKAAIHALGLKLVSTPLEASANSLTAVYFPAGIDGGKLLATMTANGVIVAGGLHKDIKTTYFRVGHMGYSVASDRGDVLKVVQALEKSLETVGYQFEAGAGVKAFESFQLA